MMRILLISLAVVVAVLAFVLDQPWLYWSAGALLLAAVVALVAFLWRRYQEAVRFRREEERRTLDREQELNQLGIMDVRPRTEPSEEVPPEDNVEDDAVGEVSAVAESEAAYEADDAHDEAPDTPASDPLLGPYLQALRTAVDAHTACLLIQEEMALDYRIEASASRSRHVRATGSFETTDPLLTAAMTRSAVTVRPVGEDGIPPRLLRYYQEEPDLQQVAFAPVPCPSAPSAYFLVVDAEDDRLEKPRAKKVLAQFAELLGTLIEMEHATEPPAGTAELPVANEEPARPRPRGEIVAEEMEKARQSSKALALVLVHLNGAEALAERGSDAVSDAEDMMHARLQQSAPRSRVERFGELTYGIFYNGGATDVEPWAERLQVEMRKAQGLLEGGVSIGVAMLRDGVLSAEQLRENATEALRLAYETGTCTIVE